MQKVDTRLEMEFLALAIATFVRHNLTFVVDHTLDDSKPNSSDT